MPLLAVRTDPRTWATAIKSSTCASQFDHEFCWDIPAEAATSCHASTVDVHFTDPVWLIQELLLDSGNHEKWVLLTRATAVPMD